MTIANLFLDLLVLSAIALGLYIGWSQGFIRIVLKTFASLFAAVLAALFFGKLATVLKDKYVFSFVKGELTEAIGDTALGVTAEELTEAVPATFAKIASIVDLDIAGMAEKAVESGRNVVEGFVNAASNSIAQMLSSIVSFLMIFAASVFVLKVLSIPLSAVIMKIPVIGTANRTLGLLSGAFATLTLVWAFILVFGFLDESMGFGFIEVKECWISGLFYRFHIFS